VLRHESAQVAIDGQHEVDQLHQPVHIAEIILAFSKMTA
jgi:hypothetical protein